MVQSAIEFEDHANTVEPSSPLPARILVPARVPVPVLTLPTLACQQYFPASIHSLARHCVVGAVVLSIGLSSAVISRAQDEPPPVARLSVVDGEASILRGDDTTSWTTAAANTPLIAGDAVFAGPDSRLELELDHNNVLRLAQQTQVRIANLTENQIQIEVSQGLVDFVVLRDADLGEGSRLEPSVEIDTPNVAVRPLAPGVYRIQVDSDSHVEITVRKGQAEVFTPEGSTTVERDKTITVEGTDSPEYRLAQADEPGAWDGWNRDRDHAILDAQSWQHANRYYTGASDLDRSGQWVEVPGYNWCWTPLVNTGWVPYVNGRWTWEPFWGWTWVSSEPWGWAPYHYGRWLWNVNRWAWWPGPPLREYHPRYAPAYVAFLGFGNSSSGDERGHQRIGWLPIGPSDYYSPWWGGRGGAVIDAGTSTRHVRRIYDANSAPGPGSMPPLATAQQPVQSNVQGALSNPGIRAAITAVPTASFTNGQPLRNAQAVDAVAVQQAQLVAGAIPVAPTRESLRFSNLPVSRAAVPAVPMNSRHLFAIVPPPTRARPFEQSLGPLRRTVEQPRTPAAPSVTGSSKTVRNGWRVVGATSQSAGDRPAAVTTSPSRSAADRTSAAEPAVPGAATASGITVQPAASSVAAEQGPPGLTITRPGFVKLPSSGPPAPRGQSALPPLAVSPESAAAPESRLRWRRFVPTPANQAPVQSPAQSPAKNKAGETPPGHFAAAPAPATQPAISGAQVGGHPSGSEGLVGLYGKPAPVSAGHAGIPGETPQSLHQQGVTPNPIERQPGALASPRPPGAGGQAAEKVGGASESRVAREVPPAKQPYLGTVKDGIIGRKN